MNKKKQHHLALDLGAGSGRAMLGSFDGTHLSLQEVHRFPNEPVALPGDGLYWNVLRLWSELKTGVARAAGEAGGTLDGLAVDTWGVDYGLLDAQGRLLANPHNYRDPRTDGMLENAFQRMPREALFRSTGIQFMQINTAFQLLSQALSKDPALPAAERLLFMPDLFHYWFTGEQVAERTIASTSQCYNPQTHTWASDVLHALSLPEKIFPALIEAGTVLGPLRKALAETLEAPDTPVIAVGGHDTASAVAAVPFSGPGEAFLSSGTWSLLGMEIPEPVINERSLHYNFTNEVGVGRTIRLLKNMTGLWLIQEMRRVWTQAGESVTYEDMAEQAQAAPAFTCFVDADDISFLTPGDMEARIDDFAAKSGQTVPTARGVRIRAAFESLVFKYRRVLEMLEELTGQTIHTIHVVGGGTRNTFLNQWIANATGRTVKTGPSEATAAGNVLLQLMATGQLRSLEEGRAIIRASFPSETFEPQETQPWADAYPRFLAMMEK